MDWKTMGKESIELESPFALFSKGMTTTFGQKAERDCQALWPLHKKEAVVVVVVMVSCRVFSEVRDLKGSRMACCWC